ncbi:hypothetical protein HY085_00240, partial [Candidatus Gottesmanbacteria bacterium]|nr:hypothetical protein [Candidatus Gottesmanbacteria bacterium]
MPRISVDHEEPDKIITGPENIPAKDKELEEKSGSSVFAAFAAFPKGINFTGEHDGEEIILLLRAHPVTNVPWLLITFLLLLIPLVIFPFLGVLGLPIGPGAGLAFFLLWYLGSFTYAFINFLSWYFNVGIITNERIVDIDWNSITNREVTVALISKIQDVTPKQIGVLSSIFDFGSIYVQTAGTEP